MKPFISYILLTLMFPTMTIFAQTDSEESTDTVLFRDPVISNTNIDNYVAPDTTSSSTIAVGSIASSFAVSPLGGAQYSVALEVPQGVGGLKPSISLCYNSQSGMGIAGWGVDIGGLSVITRAPRDLFHDGYARGVKHDGTDALCLDGRRLIFVSGTDGQDGATYHPEGDPYTTVTIHGTCTTTIDNRWMEVATPDGKVYQYGHTTDSKQSYVSNGNSRIHAWYINRTEDANGNYMTYTYGRDNLYVYPILIEYGKNSHSTNNLDNSISFSYTSLGDAAQSFRLEGVEGVMNKKLLSITAKTNKNTFRTYSLIYNTTGDGSSLKFPRLVSVNVTNSQNNSLPPLALSWNYIPAMDKTVGSPTVPLLQPTVIQSFGVRTFFASDLTGDGLSDLVELVNVSMQNQSGNGIYHLTGLNVYGNEGNSGSSVSFANPKSFSLDGVCTGWISSSNTVPTTADFDGDGINDMALSNFVVAGSDKTYRYRTLYGNKNSKSLQLSNTWSIPVSSYTGVPLNVAADFNNDGYGDFLYLETAGLNNQCACHIIRGQERRDSLDYYSFQLDVDGMPLKLFCGDYNNDGLMDIMVIYVAGYRIYWNSGTTTDDVCFSKSNSTFDTTVHYLPYLYEGDFNGDGIPDLLMNGFGDYAVFYFFALGNGDGTFTVTQAYLSNIHDQATSNDNNKFSFIVYDFDHDGKSDVVLSKAMYNNHNNFANTYVLWLRSTGTTLELVRQVLIHDIVDASPTNHMIGDFRGNGALELMSYGNDLYTNLINPYNSHQFRLYQDAYSPSTGKVGSFLDGYGNQTSVCYASLTNSSVYSKSEGYEFPLSAVKADISVVSQVCQTNGICPAESNSYFYEDLLMHRQGKGLLGFRKSQTTQSTRNLVTVHEQRFDSLYFVPVERNDSVFLDGSVSTTVSRNTLSPVSCTYGSFPNYSQTIDFDGYSVTTAWEYDTAKGMPTKETVTLDNVNQYKETTYSYIHAGGAWRPTITEVKSRNSSYSPVVTSRTTCSYDTTGRPLSVVENAQSTLALTTAYTYDAFGNVLTSVQTGQGISPVTTHHEYDATRRFVTRTYTTPASTDINYTYDTWGNLLTETDNTDAASPLTTTHSYDGWGRRTATTSPTGAVTHYDTGWGSSASQKWFTVSRPAGGAWTKTWHDATGRETSTESKGMKNVDVTTSTTYDSRGRVLRKTSTEGTLTTWEEYGYDNRDRVTSITRSTGSQTSYTYVPRKVTEVTDGRTFEKSFDAWGNVTRIDDDIHSVSYSYRGDGKMTSALGDNRGGGGSYISYDDAGNKSSLNDASAGTTTYEYNALGQVTRQTDVRGKETTYRYDALNRLVSENADGDSVVYVYGTSGNSKGRLSSRTRGNRTLSYTYDKYGRTVSETRTFSSGSYNSYTFRYSHDKQGRLTSRTFPSMYTDSYVSDTLRIEYIRNGYGQLIGMNQAGTGASLWRLDSYDGRNTVEILGDTIRRTTALNAYGYPQQVKMMRGNSTLRQMNFQYNAVTGNLIHRTSLFNPAEDESFAYDDADRLTRWEQDFHAPAMEMTYSENGNISTKTNVGQYSYGYDWHRPFAVERVTNAQGVIPSSALETSYDARGKVSTIYEFGTWKEAIFTYGPDGERWKMDVTDYGDYNDEWTYIGDMERFQKGHSTVRGYWYLGHGVMMFKDTDVPAFNTITPLYAFTDNQGSYIDFYRSNGTRVFEAKYDPWGVQTVVTDSIHFHRGYGGHEMLNYFGIINMGGRLYDPVLGRFLSPDNYVQEPFNTQNLNRYSYCLNNPVKYTDPSGDNFALWGAVIMGAYMGGATVNGTYNPFRWDFGSWETYAGMIVGGGAAYAGAITFSGAQYMFSGMGASPIISNVISGFVSGMVSGGLNGAGMTIISGGNIHEIKNNMLHGMAIGGIGGAASSGLGALIGNFKGVEGSAFKNGIYELGYSFLNGLSKGFASGAMEAAMTHNYSYIWKDAIKGAIKSMSLTGLKILSFGTTFVPNQNMMEDVKDKGQIYRRGSMIFKKGEGLTLGKEIIAKFKEDMDYNRYLIRHENAHINQIEEMGMLRFYGRTLFEYAWHFLFSKDWREVYFTPGTLEYNAEKYAFDRLGYYYNILGQIRYTFP